MTERQQLAATFAAAFVNANGSASFWCDQEEDSRATERYRKTRTRSVEQIVERSFELADEILKVPSV